MSFIRKNKNLLFACFASLALILAHYVIFSEDYSGHAKKLEEQFQQNQAELGLLVTLLRQYKLTFYMVVMIEVV